MGDCCKVLVARHDTAIAYMKSQCVNAWSRPAYDQTSQDPSMDGGGAHAVPASLRNYWQLMAAVEGEPVLIRRAAPARWPVGQDMTLRSSHPGNIKWTLGFKTIPRLRGKSGGG